MPSQGHDIEDGIVLKDLLMEVFFMMIVIKGIKEVVQVHRKEVFRFCLYPHLNLIRHHLKGKEVVKVLVHLKEVLKTIIEEVVPVHLQGVGPKIILIDIMSKEVVKDLLHLKIVLRIIQWIILIQVQDVIEVVRVRVHLKDIIKGIKEVVLGHMIVIKEVIKKVMTMTSTMLL